MMTNLHAGNTRSGWLTSFFRLVIAARLEEVILAPPSALNARRIVSELQKAS